MWRNNYNKLETLLNQTGRKVNQLFDHHYFVELFDLTLTTSFDLNYIIFFI